MPGFFGTFLPNRLGMAGHLLGLLAAAVLLGALSPRVERPGGAPEPNAWDYEYLNEATCERVIARLFAAARESGAPAWIWVDESTPGAHANVIAMAGKAEAATLDGMHLVAASRVAQPTPSRPVPAAFATDELAGLPETPCRFPLNGVHSVPKLTAPR